MLNSYFKPSNNIVYSSHAASRPRGWTLQGKSQPAAAAMNHDSQQVVWLRNKWKRKWFMGLIQPHASGLSLGLLGSYILGGARSTYSRPQLSQRLLIRVCYKGCQQRDRDTPDTLRGPLWINPLMKTEWWPRNWLQTDGCLTSEHAMELLLKAESQNHQIQTNKRPDMGNINNKYGNQPMFIHQARRPKECRKMGSRL